MFLDEAKINIKAGNGGNGLVSFFILRGSKKKIANGGSGGNGGDIIFMASRSVNTLIGFRKKVHFKAGNGGAGMPNNRSGRNGEDLVINVPPGTIIRVDSKIVADLDKEGKKYVAARGGKGGRGNSSFVSQKRRFPGFAELGEKIEDKWIKLELRLLADAALVGFPNSGKSTIISRISAARPKIADYPFTTLTPNLGVVSCREDSFVVADIPGIIEGAHEGTGLGDRFLRHILRVKVIVIVLDGSVILNDTNDKTLIENYRILRNELKSYDASLYSKDFIIVINKMDLFKSSNKIKDAAGRLKEISGREVFLISAVSGSGVDRMVNRLYGMITSMKDSGFSVKDEKANGYDHRSYDVDSVGLEEEKIKLLKNKDEYVIKNKRLERMVAMTDLENEEALDYLKYKLKKMKIGDRLKKMGVEQGDTVVIGDLVFELID